MVKTIKNNEYKTYLETKKLDNTFSEMIFYPQHCYDCLCCYVSKERHARCWSCNSDNTVNCYGEMYEDQKENKEILQVKYKTS